MSTVHCSILNEANFKLMTFFCCFSIASLSNFFKSTLSVTNPSFLSKGASLAAPRNQCEQIVTRIHYIPLQESLAQMLGKSYPSFKRSGSATPYKSSTHLVLRGQSWSNGRIHPAAPPLSTTVTSNDLSLRL